MKIFCSYLTGRSILLHSALVPAAVFGVTSAQTVEIKLQANESLGTTLGNADVIYFEPYYPTPLEPMSCNNYCPCFVPGNPDCDCGIEKVCGGSIPINLASGNTLSFHWDASMNGDKFISIKGNKRTRVEFSARIEGCESPFQAIEGPDITFEIDDEGLDASQKYTLNTDNSWLTLGTCEEGCAPECEISIRMQFDPDNDGVLDMKFRGLSFSANYDPQMVTQRNDAYEWATNKYTWIRRPEDGDIDLLQELNPGANDFTSTLATTTTTTPATVLPGDVSSGTTSSAATSTSAEKQATSTLPSATVTVPNENSLLAAAPSAAPNTPHVKEPITPPADNDNTPTKSPTVKPTKSPLPRPKQDGPPKPIVGAPTGSPSKSPTKSSGYSVCVGLHIVLPILGCLFLCSV